MQNALADSTAVGNKATEANPSGLSLTYSYNDVDRLSSISDGTNTIASYTYLGIRPKMTTFENGARVTGAFAGFRSDVATILHQKSTSTTIVRLDYAYNAVHDRLYERYGAMGSAGDAFAYDNARKLSTAWMGSVNPTTPSTSQYVSKIDYILDDDGNRASVATTPWGGSPTTSSYSTNSLDQYTSVGGVTQTWDSNGNLTNDGTFKYEYNYKNLVCRVRDQSNNLIATYKHDASGRRVEKDVVGVVFQRFVYSGHDIVATYDGTNAWKQSIVYQQGVDAIVMLEQADVLDYDADSNTIEITRHYYHRNAAGSVMAVTDMNQNVAVSYRYDPYGAPTITRGGVPQSDDPLGQHWMHLGSFYDEEVDKYCYVGRTYDPAHGRFQQRGCLGYLAGPNLYGAYENSPVNPCVEAAGSKGMCILLRPPYLFPDIPNPKPLPTLEDLLKEMDRLRRWPKKREDGGDGPTAPPTVPGGTPVPGGGPTYGDPSGGALPPGFSPPPSGKPTVNCEVFAIALYNDLAGLGYKVTYTILRYYKRERHASSPTGWAWVPATPYAWHTLVDVHTDKGLVWLEAQRPGHNSNPNRPGGYSTEPDADGDGEAKHVDKPGNVPTETNGDDAVRTEVYDSPQAAQAAGAVPNMR